MSAAVVWRAEKNTGVVESMVGGSEAVVKAKGRARGKARVNERSPQKTDDASGTATTTKMSAKKPTKRKQAPASVSDIMPDPGMEGRAAAVVNDSDPESAQAAPRTYKKPAPYARQVGRTPAKRPAKRLKKSESIIINSDDSNPAPAAAEAGASEDFTRRKETEIMESDLSSDEEPLALGRAMLETSRYFNGGSVVTEPVHKILATNDGTVEVSPAPKSLASPQRMFDDKDAGTCRSPVPDAPTVHPPQSSPVLDDTSRSIVSALAGFSYHDSVPHTISPARLPTGEAPLKKVRVEAKGGAGEGKSKKVKNTAKVEKPKKVPKPKAPKPPKKPKKKALTITELATTAYQPAKPAEDVPAPTEVSIADMLQLSVPESAVVDPTIEKPKKPRKPRASKMDGKSPAVKKTPKAKRSKAKVKFKEDAFLQPLYSPSRARGVERAQGFLFGTSSQLATDESPAFIRDMQLAIRISEGGFSSQPNPPEENVTGGLSVVRDAARSIRQASRALWSRAARDDEGTLHSVEATTVTTGVQVSRALKVASIPVDGLEAGARATLLSSPPVAEAQHDVAVERSPTHFGDALDVSVALDTGAVGHERLPEELTPLSSPPLAKPQHEAVEKLSARLEDASAASVELDTHIDGNERLPEEPRSSSSCVTLALAGIANAGAHTTWSDAPVAPVVLPLHPPSDDSWMLLKSDGSVDQIGEVVAEPSQVRSGDPKASLAQPTHLVRPPPPMRSRIALGTLDRNKSISLLSSPDKLIGQVQRCSFATSARICAPASPPAAGKPRGRPPKERPASSAEPASPKRRGRPRNAPAEVSCVEGRPTLRATMSLPQTPHPPQWTCIDEISDSDVPGTPSPPRRRAASSSPKVPTLTLAPPPSPPKAQARASTSSVAKAADPRWASIKEVLFPRITRLVRSTAPSVEPNAPTWHEKILLYDPIVLEDLTAWLTDSGLRYEVRRPKPKPRAKRKSKKIGNDAPIVDVEQDEFENVEHTVSPWMVQKWCEEKSICCLWKEGLRGGVRTRY